MSSTPVSSVGFAIVDCSTSFFKTSDGDFQLRPSFVDTLRREFNAIVNGTHVVLTGDPESMKMKEGSAERFTHELNEFYPSFIDYVYECCWEKAQANRPERNGKRMVVKKLEVGELCDLSLNERQKEQMSIAKASVPEKGEWSKFTDEVSWMFTYDYELVEEEEAAEKKSKGNAKADASASATAGTTADGDAEGDIDLDNTTTQQVDSNEDTKADKATTAGSNSDADADMDVDGDRESRCDYDNVDVVAEGGSDDEYVDDDADADGETDDEYTAGIR